MDNDNEGYHEEKQSKDIEVVQEHTQENIAAKPDITSSIINACLKELNRNEEKEEGNQWIRKLRGDNRKDTKLYACKLHGVKCTKIHWTRLQPREQELIQEGKQ